MLSVARRVSYLYIALCANGGTSYAWDEFEFVPPEKIECSLNEIELSGNCFRWQAFSEVFGVSTTADGFVSLQNNITQFAGATATEDGPVGAVIVLQSAPQFRWLDYQPGTLVVSTSSGAISIATAPNVSTPEPTPGIVFVKEAYITAGDQSELMFGRKRTVARFDDDVAQGLFGPFRSDRSGLSDHFRMSREGHYLPDHGLVLPNDVSLQRMGSSIQLRTALSSGWTAYAAVEEVDRPDGGVIVGGTAYDGEGLAGHVTLVSDGMLDASIDSWALHTAATADFDLVDATFALVSTTGRYWHAMGSFELTIEALRLAGSIEQVSDGETGWAASTGIVLGPFDIELGTRQQDGTSVDARQSAAVLSLTANEALTAQLEFGNYDGFGSNFLTSVSYLVGRLRWEPGGDLRAEMQHQRYSNGAANTAVSVSKVIR